MMTIRQGRPFPLGATIDPDGINFAVFARHATAVFLDLFDTPDDTRAAHSIGLDPDRHRTGDVWHVLVPGLTAGQAYGYRVDGPYTPLETGDRYNPNKLLMDPYARAFHGSYRTGHDALFGYDRRSERADLSFSTLDSAPHVPRCIALPSGAFDEDLSRRPRHRLDDSIIYEVHLRGFTIHPSSAVQAPGTFAGLTEKIPELVRLGVTAVELMPVQEFDRGEAAGRNPFTGQNLHNYWGYSTLGFFAPEHDYACAHEPSGGVTEFREMVKALHRAGIEVILDVVFNHTAEGDQRGPTLCFRGLDNRIYYVLEGGRFYRNYSGCGNTVNCNHPVVKQFIVDCLRYWVVEMGVDGFRFDLATILGRNRSGSWIEGDLGLLTDIAGDAVLRGTKLIAESWDAAGMYKVGGFPKNWAEWNGRFRDDVRRFIRGDQGMVKSLAQRLGGSPDVFGSKDRPAHSINFVTAHDGFTLRDLVSYDHKHNAANGEQNTDGSNDNLSANHGVEGPTEDPSIERLRIRQAKNFLVALLTARGTPMLLGGDELWRTQGGNNNAYNQDNPISWFDWSHGAASKELRRFVARLTAFRRQHPGLRRACFASPDTPGREDIFWHGVELGEPDYSHHSHSLALHIIGAAPTDAPRSADHDIYVAFNAWTDGLAFQLPGGITWRRICDTSRPAPEDIHEDHEAPRLDGDRYYLSPRSALILLAE